MKAIRIYNVDQKVIETVNSIIKSSLWAAIITINGLAGLAIVLIVSAILFAMSQAVLIIILCLIVMMVLIRIMESRLFVKIIDGKIIISDFLFDLFLEPLEKEYLIKNRVVEEVISNGKI